MKIAEVENLKMLDQCNVCLVMITQAFMKDESVWYQAIEANKRKMILVALIEDGSEIPARLKNLNWSKKYYFTDMNDLERVTKQVITDMKQASEIDHDVIPKEKDHRLQPEDASEFEDYED